MAFDQFLERAMIGEFSGSRRLMTVAASLEYDVIERCVFS